MQETQEQRAKAIEMFEEAYRQLGWKKNPNLQDIGFITENCIYEFGMNEYRDGTRKYYVVLHERFGKLYANHVDKIKIFDQDYEARGYIKDLQEQAVKEGWR